MTKYQREATTIERQIDILFSRGLDIVNEDFTKQTIQNIGYFKFKGYCVPFYSSKDKFTSGTKFENVYESYKLDQEIHSILYTLISRTEAQLKSRLGSFIALERGPLGYNDSNFFRSSEYMAEWNENIENCKNQAASRQELYVRHYKEAYENTFPIWVILEMFTIGNVSKMYTDMNTSDQKTFSKKNYNVPNKRLENWLHCLTLARNACAHNNRTFCKPLATKASFNTNDQCVNSGSVFSVFYLLKQMCFSKSFYNNEIQLLRTCINKKGSIDIKHFGFPSDWEEYLFKN